MNNISDFIPQKYKRINNFIKIINDTKNNI